MPQVCPSIPDGVKAFSEPGLSFLAQVGCYALFIPEGSTSFHKETGKKGLFSLLAD